MCDRAVSPVHLGLETSLGGGDVIDKVLLLTLTQPSQSSSQRSFCLSFVKQCTWVSRQFGCDSTDDSHPASLC